ELARVSCTNTYTNWRACQSDRRRFESLPGHHTERIVCGRFAAEQCSCASHPETPHASAARLTAAPDEHWPAFWLLAFLSPQQISDITLDQLHNLHLLDRLQQAARILRTPEQVPGRACTAREGLLRQQPETTV